MTAVCYYPFDHHHDLEPDDLRALLGGKGAGLAVMTRLGIPVPPGFTIPTDVCRQYLESGWSEEMEAAVRDGIAGIEAAVGRRLGDPSAPLLVSVRSGAAVSMPGMMDTVLDAGTNSEVARGLGELTGDPAFGWDTLRRAMACLLHVVHGVGEDEERRKLAEMVDRPWSDEASAEAMSRQIHELDLRTEPWDQVMASVEAVFRSWNSDRAIAYRRREGIDPEMGTAATVQAMVFGNLGSRSGTGVAFSRDPSTGEPGLMGDFLVGAQGDDVVAGTHQTMQLDEMASLWPDIWSELQSVAATLEHHTGDVVDLEFTVEEGRLWLLQSRAAKRSPLAVFRTAVAMANDETFPVDRAEAVRRCEPYLESPPEILDGDAGSDDEAVVLATGLAASPGRAIGVLSLDPNDAVEREARGEQVVLVRQETSPADVHGMAASVGIVTTLGGLVSHAAVVARSWGLAAVVGAKGIELEAGALVSGDRRIEPGETLTVDGDNGRLLLGEHQVGSRVPPEVEVIRVWARGLDESVESNASRADSSADLTIDDCLRVVALKGMGSGETVADALGTTAEWAEQMLGELENQGLVSALAGGRVRPTPGANERLDALFESERQGIEPSFAAALDRFHEPNMSLKRVVTDWQMKEVDGSEVPNDHSDEAYDAAVLDRLRTEIHEAAVPVIDEVIALLPRLARYRERLGAALQRLDEGDHRFVAHPLLDSYHTVWFELHEELIRLAARDRRSEAEAGRA